MNQMKFDSLDVVTRCCCDISLFTFAAPVLVCACATSFAVHLQLRICVTCTIASVKFNGL